ncbi:ABC transporter ATP-binding protein [Candidatus Nitrosacidococcus sp. I8]|uniref:ABC transporter ATP-binding protein n=1 Tax=Candidatus Nitrosacidococcus sp. I8 TaxID=2942908 RepID=UPI002227F2EF|nr:ATP-binding cassette domain-containing protein [Candidatus Nitrosacidococcus sp. I8]CAH9019347.1 putative ribonucleotide transport ATP-binding protein mkl [Candidatus Nitrosacidococcus sp. I8]
MDKELEAVVKVQNLYTRFGEAVIHKDISFDIHRGEIFAIIGGSGSGKSTLLREIAMLNSPSSGTIQVFGKSLQDLHEKEILRLRTRFAMMFQKGALFSSFTVLENIALPLKEHTDLSSKFINELALQKIELVGLPRDAAVKFPRELSGGMIKRAAVARSLALDPELLLLDEPGSGLDPVSASALDDLILSLRESLNLTVVLVTHDLGSLWRIADRVAFLGEKILLGLDTVVNLAHSDESQLRAYFRGERGHLAYQENTWIQK